MNAICELINVSVSVERMLVFIVLAPLAGGLLAGVDRKLSARFQGRYGPPVRQPFFDVLKLFQKERIVVNKFQNFNIVLFFLFTVFSGALFLCRSRSAAGHLQPGSGRNILYPCGIFRRLPL